MIPLRKCYLSKICCVDRRKQDEAFERLTKLNIVREHKGMLHLDDNFRKQFKSALTGGLKTVRTAAN